MSVRAAFLIGLAALSMSACVPSTENAASTGQTTGPVEPGAEQADGLLAMAMFSDICIKTSPSFRGAPAALAKLPFRQHPETGTYYHRNVDLSVKLMPKRCSMVFTSKDDPGQLGMIAGTTTAMADQDTGSMGLDPDTGAASTIARNGTLIEFTPTGRQHGRSWYRIVAIAP